MGQKRTWGQYIAFAGAAADRAYQMYNQGRRLVNSAVSAAKRRKTDKKRKRPSKGAKTTEKKRRTAARPRMGASDSKSSGRFPKSYRKRLNSFERVSAKGVSVCTEYGGVAGIGAGVRAVYLGHGIFTREYLRKQIARAIVKWISVLAEIDIVNFQTAIPSGWTVGVILYYKTTPAGAIQPFTVTTTAGVTTWEDMAIEIESASLDTTSTEFSLVSMELRTGSGSRRLYNLMKATLQIYVKSALKLQNRTVASSGNDESDDVDNVPLYGKSYYGTGNYFATKGDGTSTLNSDIQYVCPNIVNPVLNCPTSVYEFSNPTGTLSEPPKKNQLFNVKGVGKAHLDPGQVKTSVLTYYKVASLNKLIRACKTANTNPDISIIDIGKYRVFAFEKMLDCVPYNMELNNNSVKVAFEHDHKLAIKMYAPKITVSNTIVRHALLGIP